MIYVIDASVALKWFVDEGDQNLALELTKYETQLLVPDILFAEVANVLRRKVRGSHISEAQAEEAVRILLRTFPKARPSATLLGDAFAISTQMDHSVYDVLYLICALRMDEARLITADAKFAAKCAAAGYGRKILSLEDAYRRLYTGQENDNG